VLPIAAPGPAPAAGEAAGEPLVFAGDGGTRALILSPGLAPGGTTMAAVRPVPSSVGKSTESPGLQPSGTTTQRTCRARNRTFFKKLLFKKKRWAFLQKKVGALKRERALRKQEEEK
jgi:hypothetical protein